MKNKKWSILVLLLAFSLILSACSGKETGTKEKTKEKDEPEKELVDTSGFPLAVENKDEAIKGGTLNVGLVVDTPFKGIFSYEWYDDAVDADIMYFASNSIFDTDGDFKITDTGIASLEVDEENKKAIVKIKEGIKWSDGQPLTIEDVIYPYEVIGHPDYDGARYDGDFKNIVGAEEYHDGKAETISGLKKIDETTLEITFKKISPAIFWAGDGLWSYAAPKHYLGDIPVKEQLESDKIRKNPVTLGAFKYDNIVNGESVQFVANENHWKGKPKLDKVIVKVVPSTSIVAELKAGKVDFAMSMKTDAYDTFKDFDNITVLGRPEKAYSYLGFNLGKWDSKTSMNIMDNDSKMGNLQLRQAMGYAMNLEEVNTEFYSGLRERATSLIPPAFKSFYDDTLKGYTYDPDKANKLLDDAGYEDKDGDGFREDPNGEKLEIQMAYMAGGDIAEPMSQFYIQNWQEIGLKVVLTTGRLIEMNSFYEKVEANDADVDIFMAAWGTGTNPSPAGLYGRDSFFNMTRYTDDKLDELLKAIDSKEAMDTEVRTKAFKEWQNYMNENVPVIPTQFRTELFPVNKRVKGVNMDEAVSYSAIHEWELTAEEPIKASK